MVWDGESRLDLEPAELDERIERFARAVDALGARPASDREIVLLPSSLARPWGRSVCAWSLQAGAALVLEPDPALRVASALWARPTVFAGAAEGLAELRRRLIERGSRRRPPLGRLRGVVALGAGVDEEEAEGWKRLGVALSVV